MKCSGISTCYNLTFTNDSSNFMKKLLTLLLSVSMVATLLVGCGGAKTEEAPATENTEEAVTTETTEEGLKIAIVSSPSGVDDGSFNQNNYEGILAFIVVISILLQTQCGTQSSGRNLRQRKTIKERKRLLG